MFFPGLDSKDFSGFGSKFFPDFDFKNFLVFCFKVLLSAWEKLDSHSPALQTHSITSKDTLLYLLPRSVMLLSVALIGIFPLKMRHIHVHKDSWQFHYRRQQHYSRVWKGLQGKLFKNSAKNSHNFHFKNL